jgi:NAD(P)H-dependent flavin oxidoreductase YrpB (nitropropane dioxygenase family)
MPDLAKIAAVGLPFWVAGGAGTPDALRDAVAHGAKGVQVGTVFALSTDSGVTDEIRDRLLDGLRDGSLHVRTDPLASPTGFPFKVAELDGTMSDATVLEERPKLCDLGFLRSLYLREDGAVGYRCPAEPDHMFKRKGGDEAEIAGRACVCNGLIATVGMGQTRKDGYAERPIVTLGSDLRGAEQLLARHPGGWTATDVVDWIIA